MKRWVIVSLVVIGVIVLLGLGIFAYSRYFETACGDRECFDNSLRICERASYIQDESDAAWEYHIRGLGFMCFFGLKECNECPVNVKVLEVKKGSVELEKLQELEMICNLPLGYVANPQEDLKMCHGILKEEIQDLLINRMHSYVLSNVGKIGEELSKIF